MNTPVFLQTLLEPWLLFLADDPTLRALQGGMLLIAAILVFLVFYATRDILLRTRSFWYMFLSILLVALLPVVGFLLYLLIRPARTITEREVEMMLMELTGRDHPKAKKAAKKDTHDAIPKE